MFKGNEVFGLQLFAAAGGKTQAKMRKAFVPGAEDAHLGGTIFRGGVADGMDILHGGGGAKEGGGDHGR